MAHPPRRYRVLHYGAALAQPKDLPAWNSEKIDLVVGSAAAGNWVDHVVRLDFRSFSHVVLVVAGVVFYSDRNAACWNCDWSSVCPRKNRSFVVAVCFGRNEACFAFDCN